MSTKRRTSNLFSSQFLSSQFLSSHLLSPHLLRVVKIPFILFSLSILMSCGGNSLPDFDNEEGRSNGSNNGKTKTGPTTIDASDGGLVVTEVPNSLQFGPPAKVSVLFNVKTETGKPVANLVLDNFRLYENDTLISQFEAQPKITPEDNEFAFSSLLLLDFSASVTATSLGPLKNGAKEFVNSIFNNQGFSGEKELAIAIFDGSNEIRIKNDFTNDPNVLLSTIDALSQADTLDSSTNLYGAIKNGLKFLQPRLIDKQILNNGSFANPATDPDFFVAGALILFTDGRDQAAIVTKQDALNTIDNVESNIALFSIGLGEEIDLDILQAVGKNGFQQVDSLANLATTFSQVAQLVDDEANSYYKLDYCSPKRRTPDGSPSNHELRIDVDFNELIGSLSVDFSADLFTSGCTL